MCRGDPVRLSAQSAARQREPGGRCLAVLTSQSPFEIRLVEETGSTNADMLELARAGLDDGIWLRAGRQTAGRGRRGRNWAGDAGNLYASTLVRLRPDDPPATGLAFVAGIAVHAVLSALAPEAGLLLKWPNDVMAGRAKLAGMLLEREGQALVVGIGVNVTHAPEIAGRETVSLRQLGAHDARANQLCAALAATFAQDLARWRKQGPAPVLADWQARAHVPGTPLAAALPDGTRVEGDYLGLDTHGNLILRLASGTIRAIHAGDIFLL